VPTKVFKTPTDNEQKQDNHAGTAV